MKRKTLTTAVLAGLTGVAGMAGVANAVHLNPDGLGQVLLYPYYSAKGGNDTLISVVNTTNEAKSVKIRFIEALNSREVLDFNLYMSEFDVWAAAITATEAGGGKIVVTDNSCTSPALDTAPGATVDGDAIHVPFRSQGYTNASVNDSGPQGLDRTASGYVEILEMGTLVGPSAAAATHSGGVPANCALFVSQWSGGGVWTTNPTVDHVAPSGGLFGAGSIINVEDGTMFSYTADAIDAWSTAINHTNPGSVLPNLNSGNLTSNVFLPGVLSVDTQTWSRGVDAVSATIMHDAIMNEYVIGAGANARSEWVVTFPTKRFYTDNAPGGPAPGAPIAPFTSTWLPTGMNGACETVELAFWDREERTVVGGVPISPPDEVEGFSLCREANVVRFSNGAAADVAEITKEEFTGTGLGYTNFEIPFTAGWSRFNFGATAGRRLGGSLSGDEYVGLPTIGFWVNTFTNGTLEDGEGNNVLANYGGSFRHRGTRAVVAGS